ncbi:MAG: hypothetical protein ACTHOI_00470, partial [Sphingomicrobium sp.]
LGVLLACSGAPAFAHGVVGQRFFPATITTDDPFAADELALPTISSFDHETDVDFDYSKTILPGFAISVGIGHVDANSPGEPRQRGFGNLEVSPTLEVARDAKHEFIVSAALDWEIGGTGSKHVAERFSTYTPTIKFGKGFGDLPDSMAYLRPFAVTGIVGYAIPGAHDEAKSIEWGGAIEYSLLHLQNNVHDQGFSNLVAHLTPIVEFQFSSPTRAGERRTTGTVNPGLIWSGQQVQLAAEAIIPINRASGRGVGFIAQLHFYMDDLFPHSLGRPLFGGRK